MKSLLFAKSRAGFLLLAGVGAVLALGCPTSSVQA